MIDTVYSVLKPLGYPLLWQKRPRLSDKPVISFHFFNESAAFMGNGKAIAYGGSLQIDVFSKNDYSKVVQEVLDALTKAGFRLDSMQDDIEELDVANELYHKIMIFNYSESEVKDE